MSETPPFSLCLLSSNFMSIGVVRSCLCFGAGLVWFGSICSVALIAFFNMILGGRENVWSSSASISIYSHPWAYKLHPVCFILILYWTIKISFFLLILFTLLQDLKFFFCKIFFVLIKGNSFNSGREFDASFVRNSLFEMWFAFTWLHSLSFAGALLVLFSLRKKVMQKYNFYFDYFSRRGHKTGAGTKSVKI